MAYGDEVQILCKVRYSTQGQRHFPKEGIAYKRWELECHEPLVKALSSFKNMDSHGKLIKPILRQLITWTPPKERITLLELFGGIGIGFEALLQSRMVVWRYFYIDIHPITKQVAASRMMELIVRFPQ
jgi:hypothetical protein